MADRRRINGPVGATTPPVYERSEQAKAQVQTRADDVSRKIFLKTGVTPSASGSAYLELNDPTPTSDGRTSTSLKLSCTYAAFATKQRRGPLRDSSERDLGVHLETALRGAIIADRWPKSGVDIIVTIVEGDQNRAAPEYAHDENWDSMNVLSGCVTVASAAIADAGIDCVDTVAGGVAALVAKEKGSQPCIVLDPAVADYHRVLAACCVAYLPNRDEVTNLWFKGQLPGSDLGLYNRMLETSLSACRNANRVIVKSLEETVTGDKATA